MKKAAIILATCTSVGAVIGATLTSRLCKLRIEHAEQNGWLRGWADGLGFATKIYNRADSSDSNKESDNEPSNENEDMEHCCEKRHSGRFPWGSEETES